LAELTAERIAMGITTYVVLLFSLSVHESAHAWTAQRMGDDTAHSQGRITLNPLAHIDPIGTLLIPLLQIFWGGLLIGWARPTPVNPRAFTSLRKGEILVSGAGPASNALLALLFAGALFVAMRLGLAVNSAQDLVFALLALGVQLNVVLALFNLVPLPPLDGSYLAIFTLPRPLAGAYREYVLPYGSLILVALVFSGALGSVLEGPITVLTRLLFHLSRI
jgi:Zn-dependent protease